jgi:hypothetical protein
MGTSVYPFFLPMPSVPIIEAEPECGPLKPYRIALRFLCFLGFMKMVLLIGAICVPIFALSSCSSSQPDWSVRERSIQDENPWGEHLPDPWYGWSDD